MTEFDGIEFPDEEPNEIKVEFEDKQNEEYFKNLDKNYNSLFPDRPLLKQEEKKDEYNLTIFQFEKFLIEKYHFKTMKDTEEIYYYDSVNGIYIKNAEWLIKKECMIFDPEIKTDKFNDIKNHISWSNYIDRQDFDKDIDWLCTKKCMVNVKTGETKEHSPDFMATVQVPHTYYHRTPCVPKPVKILKFLHEVIPSPDVVETVLDFIAYCLYRGFPFHRFLLCLGSGRNGKGVTTKLVTKFLGDNNVSNETLDRILDNNFSSANLYGKMVNVDADVSKDELQKTGKLKTLTGGDRIVGEYKFRQAFSFTPFVKLIFCANQMPITPDESDAFFARPIMISFPNQFLGDKADPDLIDKLTTNQEMDGFLSLILERIPRVLKDGIFEKNREDIIQENYIKYKESSDLIGLFIESCITHQDIDNYWETKVDVHKSYEKFCSIKNLPSDGIKTFSRKLLKDYSFEEGQKKINGNKVRTWVKIQLRDYKPTEQEQEIFDL